MQGDDEPETGQVRISSLMHALTLLIAEAADLDLPRTGVALRAALLLCDQEQDGSDDPPAGGWLH